MPKPSPKRSGDSPVVDECVRVFRSHLHMPDCSPVFAALGAVAANYLVGDPIWLMLVGAPSTGKTVIVKACSTLPDCRIAPDSHNSSAFLTWDLKRGIGGVLSPPRIEEGESTGGIGQFGILIYPEFTTILSLPPDARTFISGVHRQIYDGSWRREFGSGGGRTLSWDGKAGALGAVTPAIDRNPMSSELGERWLYYRFPEPDLIAQANSGLSRHAEDPAARRQALSDAIAEVFRASGISQGLSTREMGSRERIRMARIVAVACTLRGAIARDHHHRDVIDLPQREGSGRIQAALTQIFLALELLGLRDSWCWKIIRKIAIDCAPALRVQFVRECLKLEGTGEEIAQRQIQNELPLSSGVLTRVMEDVKLLGIVEGKTGSLRVATDIRQVLADLEADA
jgi:hypothetical protein